MESFRVPPPSVVYRFRIRQSIIKDILLCCRYHGPHSLAPGWVVYVSSENGLWLLLDVRSFHSSRLSPGLSLDVHPPLAGPLQCFEGFSPLLEATVLVRIVLMINCWKPSITLVHSRCRIGKLIVSPSAFLRSVSVLPSQEHLPRPSPSGSASGLLFPSSTWAQCGGIFVSSFCVSQETSAVVGKCASLWGIPS